MATTARVSFLWKNEEKIAIAQKSAIWNIVSNFQNFPFYNAASNLCSLGSKIDRGSTNSKTFHWLLKLG